MSLLFLPICDSPIRQQNVDNINKNCHHDYFPVIPGISEPTYTEEELREMNRKENITVEYGGKQYTKYEALQCQRRLETKMRAQRQEIHLLEVGGASEDDIIAARSRYRVTSGEYTRFSKAVNLPQQRERVTVDGLGNVGVGKWKKRESESVLSTNNKSIKSGFELQKEKTRNSIDISSKNDIIQTNNSLHTENSVTDKQSLNSKNDNSFRDGSRFFSDETKNKIYQHERIISGNNYEKAILYDKDGNNILEKKGDASHVSFTKQDIKKMRGGILTHNHPNDSTFSPNDINMLKYGDLSEIRACTSRGTYILRRSDIWDEEISSIDKIKKEYSRIENDIGLKYRDKAAREGKSILYYLDEMDEECMRIFSEQHNLEFIWEAKK
ncbi:MAG: phage minor capsid protein [Acutalibacteraceae bacterium]